MRILHIVSSLNVGGAERFVIDLASEQASDHSVSILSMSGSGEPLEQEARAYHIPVHCVPNQGALSQLRQLRAHCKTVDIVHVHSSFALPRILLATRFLQNAPKVVYTRHNERVHNSIKWRLVYWLSRRWVAKFVFVAEKARANFLQQYSNMASRCETVLNGVLPVQREAREKAGLHLGHVGRFVPLKSQHVLVNAAALLPIDIQPKVTLHFFGTGPEQDKVRALANDPAARFSTIFHGHESDRVNIYSQFDVLIVTSETEGLSLAILEAMAAKMPVIASEVGGNPELVSSGNNGYLYPYADAEKLAEQIKRLINDPALLESMGKASYARYIDAFSMQTCAQQYARVYQQACTNG
ncbi:glycosyltransferase family 4 protein [Alteromonas oceanisediminis]|uniref:glycosyltransferase family 4 protein n=1 Tax=Alteromonas oceanisediminis TaxID=2836180 RepID=UPI001BDA91AF|nr:glycosyltransferase family 4 protein [Alteromonas oceanisediminis]MBT0585674.1 glycosyltransferase family 4 protein [Alteromonas oceanisediminis]